MNSVKIAYCDDDLSYINTLCPVICTAARSVGLQVAFSKYSDGLKLISDFEDGNQFDIIILDIEMPSINGKTLAEKLRQLDNVFSLIFISDNPLEVFDTLRYHISAFIPKEKPMSFCYEELSRVFRELLILRGSLITYDVLVAGEKSTIRLLSNNILGFYMKDKNIIIKTMQKEYLLQEKIFKNVIKALKSDEYIECSRNHVVNINGIQEIRSDSLVFINNDIFPVSRRRYKPLLNAFNNSIIKEAGN